MKKEKKWKEKGDVCRHPEHEPPMFRYYPPGTYEHTCPGCGHRVEFTVEGVNYWREMEWST
jgi:hypothetical protein